jgi:serine/threonine protein kinase
MADVYEATDHQLRRQVAVKVFRAAAASDRTRFDAEVVVLAALNHPGLVQVYDAGDQDGDAFVVLELVDGPTLATRLHQHGPFPPLEVAAVGTQVADALAYVHERGVVHRDVTPSNVLCGPDGRPRLADFGIARLVDTTRITAAATAIGTAAYMAPEQVQGHDVTPAADVYSLGLVLLELLTGEQPFTGSPQEVAVARLVRNPDLDGVPGAWRDLLAAMTDRAAGNRPSAAEVRDRLTAMVDGAAQATGMVAATPPAPDPALAATSVRPAEGTTVMPAALIPDAEPEPAPPRTGARRAALVALVAGLLALAVGAAAFGGDDLPTSPTTTSPPDTTVASTTTTAAPVVVPPADADDVDVDEDPPGKGKGRGDKGDKDD